MIKWPKFIISQQHNVAKTKKTDWKNKQKEKKSNVVCSIIIIVFTTTTPMCCSCKEEGGYISRWWYRCRERERESRTNWINGGVQIEERGLKPI